MTGLPILAALLLSGGLPARAADPQVWLDHLNDDLLPFWSDPFASGTPAGAFAGELCNDGSEPVPDPPDLHGLICPGVQSWGSDYRPRQTLVAQSRQVYSYATAFLMTGERRWLDLARAGAAWQFDALFDPDPGLFNGLRWPDDGSTLFHEADSQKQAYGLLGPSFVYFLTGDATLGARITATEATFDTLYRQPETGSYSRWPNEGSPGLGLVSHLDQLNSYMAQLARHGPLAGRDQWRDKAVALVRYIRATYYDPTTGMYRKQADQPLGSLANLDYGHAIKALWFTDQVAALTGDGELQRFARDNARRVLDLAWDETLGTWRTTLDANGAEMDTGSWWIHAELDQYAAVLARTDPEIARRLALARSYWLTVYVDGQDHGIWATVDLPGAAPVTTASKHWEWKAGFHSFEHALVSYLADSAAASGEVTLYFARRPDSPDDALPYGYTATGMTLGDPLGTTDQIWPVTLSGLSYADIPAVPLPGSGLLTLGGGAMLVAAGRSRAGRG